MGKTPHRRAYVNPQPGFSEAQQRAEIAEVYDDVAEWYVESRTVTRADFIEHLRPGDEAIVARVGCLARLVKDIQVRDSDLKDARGDINAKGAVLVSANEKLRADVDWPAMKAAARQFFLWSRNVNNGSGRKLKYTDDEIRAMLVIKIDKRHGNDASRWAAMKAKKIKPPSRAWYYQILEVEASKRGIRI